MSRASDSSPSSQINKLPNNNNNRPSSSKSSNSSSSDNNKSDENINNNPESQIVGVILFCLLSYDFCHVRPLIPREPK
jgi:hypothetical protein